MLHVPSSMPAGQAHLLGCRPVDGDESDWRLAPKQSPEVIDDLIALPQPSSTCYLSALMDIITLLQFKFPSGVEIGIFRVDKAGISLTTLARGYKYPPSR